MLNRAIGYIRSKNTLLKIGVVLAIGLCIVIFFFGQTIYYDFKESRKMKVDLENIQNEYDRELKIKIKQIELLEITTKEIKDEVAWARHHVAQREQQIKNLKLTDGVKKCLNTLIDPALAP